MITIFADASYCDVTGATGWGAWIKRTGEDSVVIGAPMKNAAPSSTICELWALVNALAVADRLGHLDRCATVMPQGDCTSALEPIFYRIDGVRHSRGSGCALSPKPRRIGHGKKAVRVALAIMREIVERLDLEIIVRHVRGHRGGPGAAWVNRQCDDVARAHMQAARGRLLAERAQAAA